MNEILFSEPAKHYLLSTDSPDQTLLVMVTPSEVHMFSQNAEPNTTTQTTLVAHITVMSEDVFSLVLAQPSQPDEEKDRKERAAAFLDQLDAGLETVSETHDDDLTAVQMLRNSLKSLRSNVL